MMLTAARMLGIVSLMGFFATFLAGRGNSGNELENSINAAISRVPGVADVQTRYINSAGMSTRINVRITADADAELHGVLVNSLHAFAAAAQEAKGSISVAYYVFAQGAEEDGIRPNAVGLGITPSVQDIVDYAK